MQIAWWLWVAAGIVLILLELAVLSFFLVWVGLAAVLVGVVHGIIGLPPAGQFFLWALASVAMTAAWFKFFKNPDRTRAGQSKQAVVGVRGLITREITELGEGEILFQRPVLGSDRWPAVSDTPIPAGERALVVDVLANTLKVAPLPAARAGGTETKEA